MRSVKIQESRERGLLRDKNINNSSMGRGE
jgi:hypothetical protein